jgi:hypothetical protein
MEILNKLEQQPELFAGLPLEMLNRFLPASVLTWLNQAPDLMRELVQFLSE